MSGIAKKMMQAAAGQAGGGPPAIEDVFSTYLYTGNGSTQAIKNGIALASGPDGTLGTSTRFDGTNDSLNKSSDLIGNSDGKTFTFSFWLNPVYETTTNKTIYHTSGTWRNQIRYGANGALFVSLFNSESSGGTVFEIQNPSIKLTFGGWNHVLISADLTDTNKRHLYINDVEATPSWSYVNNTVDFTRSTHAIGDDLSASTGNLHGDLAHFFLDYTYRDLSVTANRRTFIDSARGSTPSSTLSALNPILYLPMTAEYSVGDNIGTGGDFTAVGSPSVVNNGTKAVAGVGEGGLVWAKGRSGATDHQLFDTLRGATKELISNSTAAEATDADTLTAFNADGFSLGADANVNTNAATYASWTFRKAPRFFDVVTYTGDGVAGREIAHNLGVAPGFIAIKATSVSGINWFCFHRSVGADFRLALNLTNAAGAVNWWNNTEPTATEFTLGASSAGNGSGAEYVAYLFAHDPLGPSGDGSDGLIACGSFTTDGSGNATVDLGWEPQWLLIKASAETGNWFLFDTMRGMPVSTTVSSLDLNPNTSDVEGNGYKFQLSATGFTISAAGLNRDWTYVAIRRGPMRAPESGTEVFGVGSQTATSSNVGAWSAGFVTDASIKVEQGGAANHDINSRLTGDKTLYTDATNAEAVNSENKWDYQEGFGFKASAFSNHKKLLFRRAPGFFDVVAYTGNGTAGRTVPHNLGVAPEMMWVKRRDFDRTWGVYHSFLGTGKFLILNDTYAEIPIASNFPSPSPTASNFTVGNNATVNANGSPYIAYLFATLPGISKVGSYTGNGSSQTIDCGFTSGARFILIKRTDSAGDWYVWDTARGIVAANDPHLSLNTTAAEVTTDDSVDPDSSGFIVNQVAATNINVSAASYIFYAIA